MITSYTPPARRQPAVFITASALTALLSAGYARAQAGYGSESNSGSGSSSAYTDPDADPALLADGIVRVTTPRGSSITACDDNETIFWTWTGDQTAAYYHRVDIYTASTTLSPAAVDPAVLEADQAAGSPLPTGLTLISPARGVRLSEQEWRWRPVNVGADSYTIYVIVRDLPTKYGQSGVFSVLQGDDTSCIITNGGTGSGTSATTSSSRPGSPSQTGSTNNGNSNNNNNNGSKSSSSGSSSGTIAAAVAVPIVVILAALLGFLCYRRRKRSQAASSSTRYANVPSGGAAGTGVATGLLGRKSNDPRANEKQEEMLPIAHSQHLRAMQTPSPMEERALGRNQPTPPNGGRSAWTNRFTSSNAAKPTAGAAAVGAAAGAVATATTARPTQPRASPTEDEKYGAKLSSGDHGLRSTSAFQDDIAAANAGGPFNDLHEAQNSPTRDSAPNTVAKNVNSSTRPVVAPVNTKAISPTSDNKRPELTGPSGWYLHEEAQKEVPSLPPSAGEAAFTDETGHGAPEEEEESQSAATSPVGAAPEDQTRSDLPAGSTAAAIAAAAAASRVFPSTPVGQQQQQQPYNRGSRPPSAYNLAGQPQQQQQPHQQGGQLGAGMASASTSTSSLRQHRRQNSGFAGVGAMYAQSPSAALDPPPPMAAMMAPPSAANTTGTPPNSTGSFPGFPVGVSFSPGQIVSFGTASGGNSRSVSSMLGAGSGSPYGPRISAGAASTTSPPSAAFNQNPGSLGSVAPSQSYGSGNGGAYPPPPPVMAQPQRPPTPTQMLPPRSSTPSGLIPASGETGRYPSWYGGSGGNTADPSTTSASSGASSPRMTTTSPFGDQHATSRNGAGAGSRSPPRPNH